MAYFSKHSVGGVYLAIFCCFLLLSKVKCEDSNNKIEQDLFSSPEETKTVIVSFGHVQEMKNIANEMARNPYYSKEKRIYAMYQAMSGYSSKCQGSAQSYLNSASYVYHDMWSSNTMIIKNADQRCVKTLANMTDVSSITADRNLPLIDPVLGVDNQNNTAPATFSVGRCWGLAVMQVPEAWEYGDYGYGYGNGPLYNGTGITVASIDTGVNYQHEDLKSNYRGNAAWKDGYDISDTPVDLVGHGTHTMGTICAQNGIGVAPGAKWITCRGCLESSCSYSALLSCCEWIICPHDASQGAPDNYRGCSTAPDVVSNSWGGSQGDKSFQKCAWALRAAGIIPVWANGNSGPKCTTANSPGDLPSVIGVGATDENDALAYFSSVGPTVEGDIKPNICAPGVHIKSAWIPDTNSYKVISGTSMATPHVSGLIALMLERCRLPYETVLNILENTADRDHLGQTSQLCGGTSSNKFPNFFYGYGRVNALNAVKMVEQICHDNRGYKNHNSYFQSSIY